MHSSKRPRAKQRSTKKRKRMQANPGLLEQFRDKRCKFILSFPTGHLITYHGELTDFDADIIMLHDDKHGLMAINIKDVSQIIPEAP